MMNKTKTFTSLNEDGFTLIELLIVVVIIGILAAIAIPVFVNQQKAAIDSKTVSDMRSAQLAVQTALVTEPMAATFTAAAISKINSMYNTSPGVMVRLYGVPTDYCMKAWNEDGDSYNTSATYYVFANALGRSGSSTVLGKIGTMSCYTAEGAVDNVNLS